MILIFNKMNTHDLLNLEEKIKSLALAQDNSGK
jgi:hypothetical protein